MTNGRLVLSITEMTEIARSGANVDEDNLDSPIIDQTKTEKIYL